jgi:acetyltransferase
LVSADAHVEKHQNRSGPAFVWVCCLYNQYLLPVLVKHIARIPPHANIYSSAFKQAGVIEAKTSEELFDMAKSLAYQPILENNRIAVVTDGGGFGVLAADAAVEAGLELPALSPESIKSLRTALPAYGISANPIDVTGDASD